MSLEQKIKDLMQGKTASEDLQEAAPMGAESVSKDQSIKASNEGDRASAPRQGDSKDASYEEREEDEENQGAVASKSTPTAPRPANSGAGAAPNYTTVGNPTSVVNMPSSKGNVAMEEIDVKGQLAAILGEDASEEFRSKATSLFEAAVIARVNSEVDRLTDALAEAAQEQINESKEEMVEKVDAYMTYVVEQWMKDNQVAVDTGLKAEITEQFIAGLKNLFVENYIEVPEEKYNVLDEMAQKIEDLEAKLNESINTNVELTTEMVELKKAKIFESQTKDLAGTEAEKLQKLIEGVDFESEGLYKEKIALIKETHFTKGTKKASAPEQLTEDITNPSSFDTSDVMSQYVQAISRSVNAR
jgi:hypothetical protein